MVMKLHLSRRSDFSNHGEGGSPSRLSRKRSPFLAVVIDEMNSSHWVLFQVHFEKMSKLQVTLTYQRLMFPPSISLPIWLSIEMRGGSSSRHRVLASLWTRGVSLCGSNACSCQWLLCRVSELWLHKGVSHEAQLFLAREV